MKKANSKMDTSPDGSTPPSIKNLEYQCRKIQNRELAKALSQKRLSYGRLVDETNDLNKQVLKQAVHIRKLENIIRNVHSLVQASLGPLVTISNSMTQLLQITKPSAYESSSCHCSHQDVKVSPNRSSRMQTVKPMIDGHVIYSPTINLTRVNDAILGRFNLENGTTSSNSNRDTISATNILYEDSNEDSSTAATDNEELNDNYNQPLTSNSLQIDNAANNNLSTVLEQTEQSSVTANSSKEASLNLSSNNSQIPIISGLFRDLCVYLSPINDVNVTKRNTRSKNKEQEALTKNDGVNYNSPCSSLQNSASSSRVDSLTSPVDKKSNKCGASNLTRPTVRRKFILQKKRNERDTFMENESQPNEQSLLISSSNKVNNFMTYNSLEGSTMDGSSEDALKVETLRGVGLLPVFPSSSSTPKTPDSPPFKIPEVKQLRNSPKATPKKLRRTNVTVRAMKKKKPPAPLKVRKALKKLSISELDEISVRKSLNSSGNSLNKTSKRKSTTELANNGITKIEENQQTDKPQAENVGNTSLPPKKKGRPTVLKEPSLKMNTSLSPKKKGRPPRDKRPTVLKEPSLKMKLRRLK